MHLVDCFVDVFCYVQALTEKSEAESEVDVRGKIDELFARKVHSARESGYRTHHYNNAKFAVCVWIDEQVLGSGLAFRDSWRSNLLQKQHFNTVKGGHEFFEKLMVLDQFDAYDMDVREVFFYCLAFGFHGKYYTDAGLSELASIRQTNLQLLTQEGGTNRDLQHWFSQLPVKGGESVSPRKPAGWAIMFGVPLILAVSAIAWMRVDLASAIENLIKSF